MKNLYLTFTILFSFSIICIAQEYKENNISTILKEDKYNLYQSEDISTLDILRALELSNIRIHKFNFGKFDAKYNLLISIDTYVNNKIIKTDTLYLGKNIYNYYENDGADIYYDYIDQVKFLTRVKDDKMLIFIDTYNSHSKKELKISKTNDKHFFRWRNYVDTSWKLNKKVPLMLYGSSWEDKKYGFQRFCGIAKLGENIEATNELLESSPYYFLFSYTVLEK